MRDIYGADLIIFFSFPFLSFLKKIIDEFAIIYISVASKFDETFSFNVYLNVYLRLINLNQLKISF